MAPRTAQLSEAALQQHVVKLLQAYARPDVCWFAVPNGELRNYKVGVKLKQAGLRAGAADLAFLIDARFHALELKTEIGTLSPKQLTFKEDVERAGGLFHVAFGLDQALGVLQGINVFRPGISFTQAREGHGVRRGSRAGHTDGSPKPFTSEARAPA
jgi:hypothetical protein